MKPLSQVIERFQLLNPFGGLRFKLRETRGDTLVEALIALLIAALGTALLATMVMASVHVISVNREALNNVHVAESAVAQGTTTSGGTVSITGGSGPGAASLDIDAPVVVVTGGEFIRYEAAPSQEGETP